MPSEFNPAEHRSLGHGSSEGAREVVARFEPRIVEQSVNADLPVPDKWPADLEALAEQLSADADFLSQRYPAVDTAANCAPVSSTVCAIPSRAVWALVIVSIGAKVVDATITSVVPAFNPRNVSWICAPSTLLT